MSNPPSEEVLAVVAALVAVVRLLSSMVEAGEPHSAESRMLVQDALARAALVLGEDHDPVPEGRGFAAGHGQD